MIQVTETIALDPAELEETFIRSSGPGGQNVNKVATAAALRFNLWSAPGVPWDVKMRAAAIAGRRLNQEGEIVILAQRFRSQERNRADAIERLAALLAEAEHPPKPRVATRPTRASRIRRVDDKTRRGAVKRTRRVPPADDET